MSTALDGWCRWLAMSPKPIPDYDNSQEIIGTVVYVAIVVVAIGIVTFVIRRRR